MRAADPRSDSPTLHTCCVLHQRRHTPFIGEHLNIALATLLDYGSYHERFYLLFERR
ncbi:MAG: hypothetical protein KatS3mg057_0902 [Herpetosiphonaceae bacterium]|nr:MAG: hypothetical protein KatS3mg057_0902 [Herpetosiphonaceae bacterium]